MPTLSFSIILYNQDPVFYYFFKVFPQEKFTRPFPNKIFWKVIFYNIDHDRSIINLLEKMFMPVINQISFDLLFGKFMILVEFSYPEHHTSHFSQMLCMESDGIAIGDHGRTRTRYN